MSSDKKKFRIIQIDGYNDSSSRLIDINDSGLIVDKQGGIYLGNASNDASAYPVKVAISEGDLLNYASIEQLTEVEEGIADSIETLENQISDVSSNLDKYLIDPKGTSNQIIKGDGTLMDISSIGGGEDNVQADWNETNTSSDAYIKNKPTLYNGTVTSVTPGTGLTGTSNDTAITTTGTINLKPAETGEIGGIKVGKDNAKYTIATNSSPTIYANVTNAGKYYAVEIDKNDKAYVYVPWTDTNDDTDTWRAIKVNGSQKLASNSSTALDISAGSNITLSWSNNKLTINAAGGTDTNYYHTPSSTSGLKIATGSGVSDMYVPYATYSTAGAVLVSSTGGLSVSSGNLSIDLESSGGLELTSSGRLKVKLKSNGGISCDSQGLYYSGGSTTDTDTWRAIKVDGTQKLSSTSSTALDICASSNISLSWNSTYGKLYISATDTDTWRPIKVDGTQKISSTSSTALDICAGSNISLSYSNNKLTISATGGTDTYHSPSSTSGLKIATGSGVSDMYVPYATATTYGVMKTPPVATSSTVGLVKIGSGISVTADGTISVSSSGGSSTDTKNTAGSSKSTSTLYLVGATSFSSTGVQTYCSSTAVYMTNGKLYASSFYETSDERLKTFKSDVEIDFDKLAKIPKKQFIWNNDEDNESNIGTSAQAIQELYPELVSETEDGYLTVDYAKLSIIALAAIDKLNKRIEELESKIK